MTKSFPVSYLSFLLTPLGQMSYALSILFLALAPLQSFGLKLGPVLNSDDGSTNIYPGSFINFTWERESFDPDGFDVNLLWKYGNLTGLKPNVDIAWGSLTVPLPNIPPDPYNIAIYQAGKPIVQRGPSFSVLAKPSSTAIETTGGSTIFVYTTDGQVRTTTVAAPATPTTTDAPSTGKKAPAGAIAGGVVGGVVLLVVIGWIVFLLRRRSSRKNTSHSGSIALFNIGSAPARPAKSTSQVSLTQATSGSSVLVRENDQLRDRIRLLESQQQALENRLVSNGVMAPDYDANVSAPHTTLTHSSPR